MDISVGTQLKQAREAQGISLEDAARATHIKLNYLQELEGDHPELLPSPANARGFLRLYSSFLKIPAQPLIDLWDTPYEPEPPGEPSLSVQDMAEQPATHANEVEEPQVEESPEVDKGEMIEGQTPAAETEAHQVEEETKPIVADVEEEPEESSEPFNLFKSTAAFARKKSKSRSRAKLKKDLPPESVAQPEVTDAEAAQPVVESEWQAEVPQAQAIEEPFADETTEKPIEPPATVVKSPPVSQKSSAEYFAEIGAALREQRETLNLNLTDIERFTHIKRPFLEALESGQFSQIPSTVQGRGMLNSYAAFLSMDGDEVMGLFSSALEAQRLERLPPAKPQPIVSGGIRINIPERFKKYMSTDMIFGGAVILFMFFFLLWGAVQVFTQKNPEATATAPSISEVLNTTETVQTTILVTPSLDSTAISGTGLPAVLPATQLPATPFATQNAAPLQLYIVAQQRAYMRITVDGTITFDGRTAPGDVFTYSGQTSIDLLTGNAAALEMYFNNEYLGKLGEVGEVTNLTFTEIGLITPTPRPTATRTVAPTSTSTPQSTTTP